MVMNDLDLKNDYFRKHSSEFQFPEIKDTPNLDIL